MTKRVISFEGTDELRKALKQAAFKEDKTVSAVIRDILTTALLPKTESKEQNKKDDTNKWGF